jgi:chlorobactene glucosyltransferase
VIDDDSTDRTLAIATAFAGKFPRLNVLRSVPLPPGWTGKSHACWMGACAVPSEVEWLCFVDADVWASPDLVASAVATASSEKLDLLSLSPRQLMKSFAERLVMPCGFYVLAFFQDLHSVQSRASDKVTAGGQFMLVRHRSYTEVGGQPQSERPSARMWRWRR